MWKSYLKIPTDVCDLRADPELQAASLNFSWPTSEGGVSKIRNLTDNLLALK